MYIYNLSKYKIVDKLKMLSTARAITWHEIFARYRPPCYAFYFVVAFVRFELRLTEKRSMETSHDRTKYVVHFAIVNESAEIFAICAEMGGLAS